MSGFEITSIVSSIIDAFTSGLDIFNQSRAKQKTKKRHKEPRITHDELQLRESLQYRPRDIRAEYDRSIVKHGERFAQGDSVTHAALAHTLLVLNTGLINIITQALSHDRRAREMSNKTLLGISEKAATDTVLALDQLNKRLMGSSRLVLPAPLDHGERQKHAERTHRSRRNETSSARPSASAPKEKKTPGPDPLIRGAWVRSRSGSSVIAPGSSTTRSTHKRTNSAVSMPKEQKTNPLDQIATNAAVSSGACQTAVFSHNSNGRVQKRYRQDSAYHPEMLLVSSEVFGSFPLSPPTQVAPPIPPKIPLETTHSVSRTRYRPPSVATFLTASTKIGEIPEYRWLDRPTLPHENQDVAKRPLPYIVPPPLEDRKRRGRGLKFWKRGREDKCQENRRADQWRWGLAGYLER